MEQNDTTRTMGHSFGTVADGYDRYRPEPPDAALDWLIPEGARSVVELGAGTGALTRRLLARGLEVRCIEPDERMREVLAARAPAAEVLEGHAEALPMADGSADVVIGASMWHWVDETRAIPEVARVLKPGGRFALLWNGTNRRVPWLRSLWAGGVTLDEDQASALDSRRRRRHDVDLHGSAAFSAPEEELLSYDVPMTRDALLGLLGTYSAIITMDPVERERYLGGAVAFLDREGIGAGGAEVAVPMRCLCWRAERSPGAAESAA
ncbi:MAG TPA: class I SAM-dependent methyltransferase [Acidimicrobiales bacterium]